MSDHTNHHDVVIIGAGFAGLYQLYRMREAGFDARVLEAGPEVGGTWYWNRYPGARCDIDSIEYSYSFDEDLQQEWVWSERFSPQPEILRYIRHVADRFDLRKEITFGARVEAMRWDDEATRWTVRTEDGSSYTARFVIAATGNLSVPSKPGFDGIEDFAGELHSTSNWPHDGVDLTDKRVAVIGTGSSGLQTITAIAPAVGELTVFQRTPCYSIPAQNRSLGEELDLAKARYPEIRAYARVQPDGYDCRIGTTAVLDTPAEEVRDELQSRWDFGGLCAGYAYTDIVTDYAANEIVAEYFRNQIREKVKDPVTADLLTPQYPIFTKRLCADTGYYEVYNQDNVRLVDIRTNPIERLTKRGIVAGDTEHEFDVVILATGFDAMTGALNAMEIDNGTSLLRDKWEHGPRTYLGLMSAGFPNLFTITGPQSPSVLSNVVTSIEQHVEWISRALVHLRERGLTRMEALQESEDNWVTLTNDLANTTIFPETASWYMGANIPGKERVFMPFVGGVGVYRQVCDGIEAAGYHGFELS